MPCKCRCSSKQFQVSEKSQLHLNHLTYFCLELSKAEAMETEDAEMENDEEITDPAFLQNVLENLPGVDPKSDAVQSSIASIQQDKDKKKDKEDKQEKK